MNSLFARTTGVTGYKSPKWRYLPQSAVVSGFIMAFVALEKLHLLHDGYRQAVRLAGQNLLLLHENGKSLLIRNACPHAGAALTQASCKGNRLRCPMHGIEFDLDTGRAAGTACAQSLQFFPLIYEGNTLGVEVSE